MAENDSVLSAARAWKGEKLAIATVVLALNMLGDGLRDSLDPRLRQ